ncbi:Rne/Rng family ribonuclease [bacterium]|nr:Rne/Rng family ribonuclease [bacterium]NIN92313.1 Rne/Rng family ribonuclease [bacterium]NIO18435.1 Rne/Rng family ribonuclease [bacterium]NIO73428.1 Rne/Rng family ribonuclease [bacterium]
MRREILVDVAEDEVRIGLVEEGHLVELFIERIEEKSLVGNIYQGTVVNVLKGLRSCFLDLGLEKNAFLPLGELPPNKRDIKKGDRLLVQIVKEPIGEKGAKATVKISLPGRYLVFMPNVQHIGISKRIQDDKERVRLRAIIKEIIPQGAGFVVRTEASGHHRKDLIRECRYLLNLWRIIEKRRETIGEGHLVHKAFGLIFYVVRELFTEEVDSLIINSKMEYKQVRSYVKMTDPHLLRKLNLHKRKSPLFDMHNLEKQLSKMKDQKIFLPCGGSIIIEQAEALTAIDVNTGRFAGGKSLEETAFLTNCQAAEEIMRQVRLRNIGGLIIIDFIEMKQKKNREKVMDVLRQQTLRDKAKIDLLPITKLGLVEMSRQRRRESILDTLCQPCPYCAGSGLVFSEKTMFIKIKKEILRTAAQTESKSLNVFMNPRIAPLFDEKKVEQISKMTGKRIKIRPDYKLHVEESEISP